MLPILYIFVSVFLLFSSVYLSVSVSVSVFVSVFVSRFLTGFVPHASILMQHRLMLPNMPILSCSATLIQNKSTKLQFCTVTGILLTLCGLALFVTKYCSCLRKGKQKVVSQKKERKEGRKEGVSAKQLQDPLQTPSSMYSVHCTIYAKPNQVNPNQNKSWKRCYDLPQTPSSIYTWPN